LEKEYYFSVLPSLFAKAKKKEEEKKKKKILENRKLYWSICRKVFAPTLVKWVG
jgi:hypothetical protein